jgi:hypothetical protein
MSLLDAIVGAAFRNEKAGRIVVFSGGRHNRGYLVRSPADESKIRSFLKMFYFAHFSILLLGMLVANACAVFFIHLRAFGEPAGHLFRSMSISLGCYVLLVGLPYILLWRSYKEALSSFALPQDEIEISRSTAGRKPWSAIVGLTALGVLILIAGVLFMVRAKP